LQGGGLLGYSKFKFRELGILDENNELEFYPEIGIIEFVPFKP
jgi:hypothetical protein